MKAFAGKAPWYTAVSETTRTGRQKSNLSSGKYEWDLTEGWHTKRQRGWKKTGLASGTVKKVKMTAPDGKLVDVYKSSGYDDSIGFHSHYDTDEDALRYAYAALDKNNPSHPPIFEEEGCGHIAKLEYAQYEDGKEYGQVLRVTFKTNGAVCVFFRVPSAVAGTLLSLARSKAVRIGTDGTERHALGIEFWDLVRIRGQRHGARYPFEYEKRGDYKLTGSNKRYKIALSDTNFKKILGNKYYGGREFKPGEEITAILSEEDYAKIVEEFHEASAVAITQRSGFDDEKGSYSLETGYLNSRGERVRADNYETHDYDEDYTSKTSTWGGKTLDEFLGSDIVKNMYGREDLSSRYHELHRKVTEGRKKAEEQLAEQIDNHFIGKKVTVKQDLVSSYKEKAALIEAKYKRAVKHYGSEYGAGKYFINYKGEDRNTMFMKKFFDEDGSFNRDKLNDWVIDMSMKYTNDSATIDRALDNNELIDKRYKDNTHVKKSVERVIVKPENFLNKEEYNDYMLIEKLIRVYEKPNEYAATYNGRAWTKQDLREFANCTIPGAITPAHAIPYKKLIQSGDYEGALNFLKNRKRDVYVDGKITYRNKAYATPYDYIIQKGD